jgi:hypothetical protein
VFLALLEQFGLDEDAAAGLQGCLVLCPGGEKGGPRLWACGVAVGAEPDALYLFDPRLGLPIPGPGGKGVATLAQARSDPSVLGQLRVDKVAYDVTPEQVKAATIAVVCPLSAAAPRMHFLQDRLLRDKAWEGEALPGQVRVRLAEDPSRALASVESAFRKGGGKGEVRFSPAAAALLRRFLPKEEGGAGVIVPVELRKLRGFTRVDDATVGRVPRQTLFLFESVPWEGFPPVFRDPENFRFDIGLGQHLRTAVYAGPFLRPLLEPGSPRDLILRGSFARAVPELVREQEMWQAARRRAQDAGDIRQGLEAWIKSAFSAYAAQINAKGDPEANARVAELWKWRAGDPIEVLMNGSIARPRGAEVMFQLALCRHEQATRSQARVDLAARAGLPLPGDAARARKTWIDAEGYWKEFLDAYAGSLWPGVAAARRLRGEAQERLGQKAEALATWRDVSAPMTELEKLAVLWLARQLDQKPPGG